MQDFPKVSIDHSIAQQKTNINLFHMANDKITESVEWFCGSRIQNSSRLVRQALQDVKI